MSEINLLAYYRWNTRRSWRRDSLKRGTRNKPMLAYVSDDRGLFKTYANKNATLWVVGLGPGRRPVLDARIRIDSLHDNGKRRVVEGRQGPSKFFGLIDASEVMMRLAFANEEFSWTLQEKTGARSWQSDCGSRFQRPRRIAPVRHKTRCGYVSPGAAPLVDLAKQAERHSAFISYKFDDFDRPGKKFLYALAEALGRRGIAVWLDRVALRGSPDKKVSERQNQMIGDLLAQGLGQSHLVIGMWTKDYGTPSIRDCQNWTRTEWRGRRKPKRIALLPQQDYSKKRRMPDPDALVRMPASPGPEDAESVAKAIQRTCRPFW